MVLKLSKISDNFRLFSSNRQYVHDFSSKERLRSACESVGVPGVQVESVGVPHPFEKIGRDEILAKMTHLKM